MWMSQNLRSGCRLVLVRSRCPWRPTAGRSVPSAWVSAWQVPSTEKDLLLMLMFQQLVVARVVQRVDYAIRIGDKQTTQQQLLRYYF